MFDSNLLDKLSRVHWTVPLFIFVPAIIALVGFGATRQSTGPMVAWFAGGLLFWTLTEYWLHRLVFHFEPDHPIGRRMHFIIHGVHHDHPNDPLRLVMPPGASIPLAAIFLALFYVVLGADAWLPFGAGFLLGYLVYDMTHFHVHHHKPKTAFGKKLREAHMRHHFQDHDTAYGVSSPLWDHVFRTAPKRRRGAKA
jgi:sterol desaturase/sphingolipid hydroxylase (fatty acid hydroxylase superfamily)